MKKEMAEKFLPESWETSAILLKLLKAPLTALHEIEKKENGETFLRRELWTDDDLLLIENCFRNRTRWCRECFHYLFGFFLKLSTFVRKTWAEFIFASKKFAYDLIKTEALLIRLISELRALGEPANRTSGSMSLLGFCQKFQLRRYKSD